MGICACFFGACNFEISESNAFAKADEAIETFLTENDFTYTREYTETERSSGFLSKESEYSIEAGTAEAKIVLSREFTTCKCSLTLTDPEKNFDGKIYDLLVLMEEQILYGTFSFGFSYANPENLMKEEYLYAQTDESTVYQYYNLLFPEYGFTLILNEESYTLYIFNKINEEFYY